MIRGHIAYVLGALCCVAGRELSGSVRLVATSTQAGYNAGFAYPVQAPDGAAVFPAYATVNDMSLVSISTGGKSTTLASTSATKVPGQSQRFTGFAEARTAPDGSTTFQGSADSGAAGFYSVSPDGATITTIADTSTVVPGAGSGVTLGAFNGGVSVDRDGSLAFVAAATAGNRTYRAIYHAAKPGSTPAVVIDVDTPMPDGQHTFQCLSGPSLAKGRIAFFGSHCLSGVLGAPVPAYRAQRMVRSRRAPNHALHDNYGDDPVPGIFVATPGSSEIVTVATSVTAVPNGADGELFVAFSDPVFDGETVGFLGLGTQGSFGLFASTISQDTPLRVIVDDKTAVPGGNGFFGDIPQTPSLAGGRFLFNVGAADGRTGIYSASSSDDITAHVTFSDTIGGQSIVYMGIQTDSFNGDVFSFYAVTTIDIIAQGSVSALSHDKAGRNATAGSSNVVA